MTQSQSPNSPNYTSKKIYDRILIVNDYDYLIWWVEQYIHNSAQILRSHGHQVKIIGMSCRWLVKYRIVRLMLFLCLPANIIITIRLLWCIFIRKPHIIYWQNIHRACGRLPVYCARICGIPSAIMYHDFWCITMYPSKLTQESDIDLKFSLPTYQWSLISYCMQMTKYYHLCRLHFVIRHIIDKHFVPTEFMKPYIQHIIHIPTQRIFILAHCLWSLW